MNESCSTDCSSNERAARTVSHVGRPSNLVRRTSAALRALGGADVKGLSTTDVAAFVDVPRPTVHRILTQLLAEGFADRDERSGRWFPGPELYIAGNAAARRFDVANTALPIVRRLADESGESSFLSVRRGDETICLLREDGSFPLRSYVLDEGSRFPLGVVSAGLAVIAHLPDAEIDRYLHSVDLTPRWGLEHGEEALRARIATTRADGYATNPGLIQEGSWGMAAAVFDVAGRPQWALSVTGVQARFTISRRPELGQRLLKCAHELGHLMRGQATPA